VTDDRRPAPLFGIGIYPAAADRRRAFELARLVDESGLDFVTVQDHPYIPEFLDTWTLLTALGTTTRRVRLLTSVVPLPLRPPAVLAKAAASLDILTDGRVELGLGTGAFWDGIASYGGPRRAPGEAVDALAEAIQVIRALWQEPNGAEETASFAGTYYRLERARLGPVPAHPIGIWLGAIGPRMLRLTGRAADGWVISSPRYPPDQIPAMQGQIDEAARRASRAPTAIRRLYNLSGAILAPGDPVTRPARPGIIVGSVGEWAEEIVRYYRDLRLDTFIYMPAVRDDDRQYRRFAEEVVPALS
jgi:alkanesulfonate monooxygenase SsuD/methylene tetrahydromethanopterin reductase-like flavin-dependent oxidoreductase (luciferase family)